MKKIILTIIGLMFSSVQVFALEDSSFTGANLVAELNKIMSQYETQLKSLQAENSLLRNEVSKAGIKIPLSEFPGAIIASETGSTTGTSSGKTATGKTLVQKKVTTKTAQDTVSGELNAALDTIEKEHGPQYRGFIGKILPDWSAIKNAYKLKPTGILAGYEFVKKGNNDHVFVDVTYEGAGTGVYDVKILYQYNTGTYARKLIGLFEYNRTTKYYITKTGTNPFAGVPRTIVLNPILSSGVTPTLSSSSTGTVATTPTTPTVTTPSTVTLAEIEKAYGDKRYLSVISLSNSYLSSNPATYDLLRIRYRTYFIIGKYSESLAEIEKINTLGRLDKSVACDAQVIATYGKNTALTNTYTSICKGK